MKLREWRTWETDYYQCSSSGQLRPRRGADPRLRPRPGEKLEAERSSPLPNNATDGFATVQRRPTTPPKAPGGGGWMEGTAAPYPASLGGKAKLGIRAAVGTAERGLGGGGT
jgi:hypothetical protein